MVLSLLPIDMPGLLVRRKSEMASVQQTDFESYSDKENSEVCSHIA